MPPVSDTDATIASLAASGFALIGPHALAPHIVAACRASPSFADAHSSATLAARFRQSSAGRHHRTAFDAPSLRAFEALEASWLPLVHAFFAAEGVDNDVGSSTGGIALVGARPFYRSELQLLQAQPLALAQFFHQDNARRGLTIVVPLVDIIHELGPTELLSGSHRMTRAASTAVADAGSFVCVPSASPLPVGPARTATSTVRAAWRDFCASVSASSYAARFLLACAVSSKSPLSASSTALPDSCAPADGSKLSYQRSPSLAPVRPCPKLGSALVFDSRCMHRGLANLSATTARPVLIFRYDSVGDVPPNHSVLSTIAVRSIGSVVAYLHRSA